MRSAFTIAFGLLLSLSATAAPAQTAPPAAPSPAPYAPKVEGEVTEVDSVDVRAERPNWLLSFTVSGDVGEQSFVGSAPIGLTCGGEFYRWHKIVANRQCWLRVNGGQRVLLSATDTGRYGVDWAVDWIGCTPLGNGSMCEAVLTADRTAGAVFRRLR